MSEIQQEQATLLDKKESLSLVRNPHLFKYQTEGRPLLKDYELETWTYDDEVSQEITNALKYFHRIYSKDLVAMKVQ